MSLGKSRWIQKIHWYFVGELSCLVARISAKGQVRCWESRRECVAAVDAFTDLIEYVLYIKEGKITSCVPLLQFLIHARGCLLWLLLPCLVLAAQPRWPLHVLQVELLRQNSNCSETIVFGGHAAFSEVCLSSRMTPSTWSHSFLLPTAGNFLFTTSAVFFLAIIFSLTHSY